MIEAAPKGADFRLSASVNRFRLSAAIVAGACAAALFGSRILLQEIDSQPDMRGYTFLHHAASTWNNAMRLSGAALPDRILHDGIRAAEAARFSGEGQTENEAAEEPRNVRFSVAAP